MPIAVGRPVNGRLVFWLCVAFVLGVVVRWWSPNSAPPRRRSTVRSSACTTPVIRVRPRPWGCCSARRSWRATAPRCWSTATRSSRRCWRRSAGAQTTITFETYIYWSGDDRRRVRRCARRAGAGRRQGARAARLGGQRKDEKAALEQMKRRRRPGRALSRAALVHTCGRLNNRTHRKLLVVDGKVGFTGGVGIADKWRGDAQDTEHWRDTHFRVEGPVVAQMQAVFMDNWIKATGRVLHGEAYFPRWDSAGDAGADVQQLAHRRQREHAPDVPDGDHRRRREHPFVQLLFRARRADGEGAGRGGQARRQGADHRARAATSIPRRRAARIARPTGAPLLEAGVEIAEYQPTMFHCKVLVVDGCWCRSDPPTSTTGRSGSTTRPTSTCSTRSSPPSSEGVRATTCGARRSVTLAAWRDRPWKERATRVARAAAEEPALSRNADLLWYYRPR